MLNGSTLNNKVLQFGSIFSLILLLTSLLSTSNIQNSNALVQEDEESAYLKFVTQTGKEISKNSSAATVQIPEGAKGPPIPPKGYLVEEIRDGLYWGSAILKSLYTVYPAQNTGAARSYDNPSGKS